MAFHLFHSFIHTHVLYRINLYTYKHTPTHTPIHTKINTHDMNLYISNVNIVHDLSLYQMSSVCIMFMLIVPVDMYSFTLSLSLPLSLIINNHTNILSHTYPLGYSVLLYSYLFGFTEYIFLRFCSLCVPYVM